MNFQSPYSPVMPGVTYGVVGFVAASMVAAVLFQRPKLGAIPAVGSSSWLGSWSAGFQFLKNAQSFIQQGYDKHKSVPFKVAEPQRWTVIISNREHIEEVAKATDVFSFAEAINDQIQIEHLLGHSTHHNRYHVAVIRHRLTRNLEAACPQIRDEIITSFAELLNLKEKEWKTVPALALVQEVVCRAVNRMFVGLPLCRDPDWIDLNIRTTIDIMIGGIMIGILPKFMRTLAGRLFTQVPQCIKRGRKLLGPIIEERLTYLKEYGTEWDGKPNDLLSWLIDEGEGPELTVERLTARMLAVNFAAIHTTSKTFTQALFYLALYPEYVQPLREEVEAVVEKDGWSKAALGKMLKVDSFLREYIRISGTSTTSLSRKALRDYTLADGTFIPKGTIIAAAAHSIQHDPEFYGNPDVFQPFRFVDMAEDSGYGPKQQFTSTSSEYLPFGHGKTACPGRFFAASEIKLMLAHVIVTYDVKLEDGATYPPSQHIGTFTNANPHAKVMFRQRVDV